MADDYEKLMKQGFQSMGEGEYAAALSKFDKAIKANPTSAEAYLAKADAGVLVPKVTQEEVIALYNKAIELEPDNPFIYQAKGAICVDVGLFNDAEAAYLKAAEKDPENSGLLLFRVRCGIFPQGTGRLRTAHGRKDDGDHHQESAKVPAQVHQPGRDEREEAALSPS